MYSRLLFPVLLTLSSALWTTISCATMKPASPMLFVLEEEGGASINVTNTSDRTELLYVKVLDLPDDPQPKLYATQPVMRLGAGKTQLVRFILNSEQPLAREHLKRVVFEGIQPKSAHEDNEINISIRQNIPVIIHPKGLPFSVEPWKALEWRVHANQLSVHNPSPYVVRLSQQVRLLPQGGDALLSKPYLLPQQTLVATVKEAKQLGSTQKVSIETLSKYGYETGRVDMAVAH